MSRRLLILTLFALPGALAACDSPKVLSKAKPGECYAVVGRDTLGAAKLAKTACPGSPAAIAAVCPPPPATSTAACPAPQGVEAVREEGLVETKPVARFSDPVAGERAGRRHIVRHRVVRERASRAASVYPSERRDYDDRVAKSGEVRSLGLEYARVDESLLGGPQDFHGPRHEGREYEGQQDRRFERNDHDRFQGRRAERREYDRHEGYAPPPPIDHRREAARLDYSQRQSDSRAYRSETSSSSSSSSYSSSGGGYGEAHCDCDGPGRGAASPTPFDQRGFLTWRGKTPG